MYKVEKEVWLIYCQGLSHYDEPPSHVDVNRKNEKTSFIELDLEWEQDDKIIFGYRIANNAKYEIAELIQELTKDYKRNPDIVNSKLQEQF